MARRSEIINLLVTQLKLINGGTDTRVEVPNTPYIYKSTVPPNNVFRKFKYLDEINDFPTICLMISDESREYFGTGTIEGILLVTLRGYIQDENSLDKSDDLLADLEFIGNSISHLSEACVQDIIESKILSASTDEGLFEPKGIVDLELFIKYQVDPII